MPSFNGSSNLAEFEVANNHLAGSIPSFSGLSSLLIFDVSNNQLTGSLPNFANANRLQGFFAGNNQLTGSIPKLNANNWESFDVSNNRLSGTIPDLVGTQFGLFAVGFNKLVGAVPRGNVASASLCPNQLTHSDSPDWDEATRVSPWYRDCVGSFANIDQVGLTGTWYSPPTSGQGFSLQIFPDLLGAGRGFLSANWMTYSGATAPYGQRWYSLQGSVSSASSSTTVAIGVPVSSGNFNAPPSVSLEQVGVATIAFSDCNHGTLTYSFFDFSSDTGTIPLTRLLPNTNCTTGGRNGVAGSSSLLSGNWYNRTTSGQGLLFDIAPGDNALFASWFTYASSGADPTSGNQRWYTLQSGAFTAGSTSLSDIPIVYTNDGFFDSPSQTITTQVGSADIAFQSCTAMTLKYNFTSGENKGLSGTFNLVRLGPAPLGCSL